MASKRKIKEPIDPVALAETKTWLEKEKGQIPSAVFSILQSVIVFATLLDKKTHTLVVIRLLLMKAWGLEKSSEKATKLEEGSTTPEKVASKKTKVPGNHETRARTKHRKPPTKESAENGGSGGDENGTQPNKGPISDADSEGNGAQPDKGPISDADSDGNGAQPDKGPISDADSDADGAQPNKGPISDTDSDADGAQPNKGPISDADSGGDGTDIASENLHPTFGGAEQSEVPQKGPFGGGMSTEYLESRMKDPSQWSPATTKFREVNFRVRDLEIRWTEQEVVLEEAVNTVTGDTILAENPIAPGISKYSYKTIASMLILHVGNQLPIHRLSRLFSDGTDSVSKSVIFWFLTFSAQAFLPIFFILCRQLASSAKVIEMDDAHTRINKKNPAKFLEKIISNPETAAEKIAAGVHEEIGLGEAGKDGNRSAFLTLLTGLLDPNDPTSRVAIKLTHFGQAGKLLDRLLEKYRNPKTHHDLWVVSDLANSNNLKAEDEGKFKIYKCGCMWHSRRRFFAARQLDDLMWYGIRCFSAFARLEAWLKRSASTDEEIARRRKVFGGFICKVLRYACILTQKTWDKGTDPWKAAEYFLSNEHTLTQFMRFPFVPISNNRCERLLRPEKLMLSASKFRDTMGGRVTYDVISTIMASCGVSRTPFLPYAMDVLKNRSKVEMNPEQWTPIAWRDRKHGKTEI